MKAKGGRRKGEGAKGRGRAGGSPAPFSHHAGGGANPTAVGIIGAGRLGTALARALTSCGYAVGLLVSRDAARARASARRAGLRARYLGLDSLEALPAADLLLITTPDDAIAETAALLASLKDEGNGLKAEGRRRAPRVALHASGALSSDALAPLRARGYHVGSLHPLAAVSDVRAGAESLRGAFFCVEGDARAVRVARRIVRDLGARSFSVPAERKALYHAAAVMAAGHAVALFDTAASVLSLCGLREREARRALLPLLRSALDNLSAQPPPGALTGTFARADVETVRKHLAALRESGDDEALEVYRLLGRRSLRLAAGRGGGGEPLALIAKLLSGDGRSGAAE